MGWPRHFERIIFAATAVAFQVTLYQLLTERDPCLSSAKSLPAFAVVLSKAVRPSGLRAVHRYGSKLTVPKPQIEPVGVRPISLPKVLKHTSRAAVDWQAAISREVGEEVSRGSQRSLRFGLPPMPAKKAVPPTFGGWDEVRIHRAQRLANGIIDLGHCVILLAFPIPICKFGRSPTNGELFKHMHHDRTAVGSLP